MRDIHDDVPKRKPDAQPISPEHNVDIDDEMESRANTPDIVIPKAAVVAAMGGQTIANSFIDTAQPVQTAYQRRVSELCRRKIQLLRKLIPNR